jgi:hypothetical protein
MTTTTEALTDEQFRIADIAEQMAEQSPLGVAPSEVARRAKVNVTEARVVLDYLVGHQYLTAAGNGSRTRYFGRA